MRIDIPFLDCICDGNFLCEDTSCWGGCNGVSVPEVQFQEQKLAYQDQEDERDIHVCNDVDRSWELVVGESCKQLFCVDIYHPIDRAACWLNLSAGTEAVVLEALNCAALKASQHVCPRGAVSAPEGTLVQCASSWLNGAHQYRGVFVGGASRRALYFLL